MVRTHTITASYSGDATIFAAYHCCADGDHYGSPAERRPHRQSSSLTIASSGSGSTVITATPAGYTGTLGCSDDQAAAKGAAAVICMHDAGRMYG